MGQCSNPEVLGHDNLYVRDATAAAIMEGVDHWPATVTATIEVLEELYREKVRPFGVSQLMLLN